MPQPTFQPPELDTSPFAKAKRPSRYSLSRLSSLPDSRSGSGLSVYARIQRTHASTKCGPDRSVVLAHGGRLIAARLCFSPTFVATSSKECQSDATETCLMSVANHSDTCHCKQMELECLDCRTVSIRVNDELLVVKTIFSFTTTLISAPTSVHQAS